MSLHLNLTRMRTSRGMRDNTPQRGFTIIELMVVVVVVAILSAIAYPSFVDSLRKGRRSDAMSALAGVQQAQERWRANNPAYAANMAAPGGLGQPTTSASGYYNITILSDPAPDATTYAITAAAGSGSKQEADTNCKVMGIQAQGGRIRYGGGSSSPPNWDDPDKCWAR
jgi:type IV pilus assembly protein PilE